MRNYKKIFNKPSKKIFRQYLRNNSTKAEWVLWGYLRNKQLNGHKFRRQYSIGTYIVDFYCPQLRLVIEVDGDTHSTAKEKVYDTCRQQYIESYNIVVLRFTNVDIYEQIDCVLEEIKQCTLGLRCY